MNNLLLTIRGDSVAKGRPKFRVIAHHAQAYTPKKTRSYEDIVRQTAIQEMATQGATIIGDAIVLRATFFRGIPKSWAKKKQQAALLGEVKPAGKPDLDNLLKAVTDGLNGVAYLDDAQIYSIQTTKLYSDEPRVEVMLSW